MFHVTDRCHNREFLLKFGCDRDGYRAKLQDQLREFEVATSNGAATTPGI